MKAKCQLPESGQNFHKMSHPPKLFYFSLDCSIFPDYDNYDSFCHYDTLS